MLKYSFLIFYLKKNYNFPEVFPTAFVPNYWNWLKKCSPADRPELRKSCPIWFPVLSTKIWYFLKVFSEKCDFKFQITVFRLGEKDRQDVDHAILTALLKVHFDYDVFSLRYYSNIRFYYYIILTKYFDTFFLPIFINMLTEKPSLLDYSYYYKFSEHISFPSKIWLFLISGSKSLGRRPVVSRPGLEPSGHCSVGHFHGRSGMVPVRTPLRYARGTYSWSVTFLVFRFSSTFKFLILY